MKKRTTIRALSYLSAAVLCLGVLACTGYAEARRYERAYRNNAAHAFGELVTAVGEMDAALEKSVLAVSPKMQSAVCTELFGKAMTAQMSLSALPWGAEELEHTADFISRVGDYAFSLSRAAASGAGYGDEQRASLRSLSETAGVLSQNLKSLQTDVQSGRLTLTELRRSAGQLSESQADEPGWAGDSVRLIEQEFPEVPALVYDGPFSEHLRSASPRALEGLAEVTSEQARAAAAAFLGVAKPQVRLTGETEGDLPCYTLAADDAGGATAYVSVTKQGGKILAMLSSRPVGSTRVSAEQAVAAARDKLAACGFAGMEETYYMIQGGILTANFAYRQGEVLCYSDLIKVSIALDSGKVCGFEARGWIESHRERSLDAPVLTAEQARAAVPAGLTVLAEQLALVPSDGKYETLCRELKCAAEDDRHYLIYLNAATGEQEKILILLEDETGVLTI